MAQANAPLKYRQVLFPDNDRSHAHCGRVLPEIDRDKIGGFQRVNSFGTQLFNNLEG